VAMQLRWIRDPSVPAITLLYFVQFFVMGFALADVYLMDWKERPAHGRRWDAVFAAGCVGMALLWQAGGPALAFGFPFVVAALFVGVFRGPWANRVLTNRWVTTIGGMCYTIYLFHYPLVSLVGKATRGVWLHAPYWVNLALQGALVLPVVLAICAVLFALVERPCMDPTWFSRLRERLRPRPALPHPVAEARAAPFGGAAAHSRPSTRS
jgi:peptidoglycan/LPS O-acetylase OafA/YrhL